MRKMVFKGVINGETFDNVKDYNSRMNQLIAEGVGVDAHSETKLAESCNCETKKDVKKNSVERKQIDKKSLFPYFDDADEEYYLDRYSTGDKNLDSKSLMMMSDKLAKAEDNLNLYLKECNNINELLGLLFDIKSIEKQIEDDKRNTEEVYNELTARIARDQNDLNVLDSSRSFIDTLLDYYQYAFNTIKDACLGY